MKNKKIILKRLPQLLLGLFLCGFGLAFTIEANLGLNSWDVFHDGFSKLINVKIGFAIFFILWVLYVSNLIGNSKNQNIKAKKEVDGCLFIIFGFSILFLLFYFLQ